MALWQWYLALSFCISLVLTTCESIPFYRNPRKPEFDKSVAHDIEEAIENGHIQREIFGNRTVLHPKDDEGRLLLEITDLVDDLPHKQKTLFFIIAVLYVTVMWPYEIYTLSRRYFSPAG